MATLQEEANHSSLSNSVLKSKNVAKKSTTKFSHSRGSSRSGSPCSMPSSLSHSRESSPEVRTSILNGKLKIYASGQEESRTVSNGPSSLAKANIDDELVDGNHTQNDEQLKSSVSKGNVDTAAASSNGSTSDGSTSNESERMNKMGPHPDVVGQSMEVSSSTCTATVVSDTHITVRNEKEVASCTLMSKPKFIQAKDVLRERLKAAVFKFSSDKSLLSGDKCSDGESSPTLSTKSDQCGTPNRCSSPVMPRSNMIDKGNLFEIMTLDLGKSSRESVTTTSTNEDPKSNSASEEKHLAESTANKENASLHEECSMLPATPGVSNEDNKAQHAVDQGVIEKNILQQKVIPENSTDKDEEMLLLGISDSNENFDTVDDSILDEDPKKDSSTNSKLQQNNSQHQSEASSSCGGHQPEESGSKDDDGVPKQETDLMDNMVVEESHSPCEDVGCSDSMECSSCQVMSADGSKSQEQSGDFCSNESNKRKLSNNSQDDLQVKRGRVDSTENNKTATDNHNINRKAEEDTNGSSNQDTNSDTKQSVDSDVKPSTNSDVKSNIDDDIKPIIDNDVKPVVDADLKQSMVQCNGDKVSHPDNDGVGDDDDAASVTTVGCSSTDLEKTTEGEIASVKSEPDGIVKISRQALENLIAKTLKEKLASSETVKQITDLQSRVDKLTEQLYRCKATAKSYQVKLADITKTGRPDRRRSLRGPVRHVGVQVDIIKQQASHMTTIQKGSNRSQSAAHQTAAAQPAASQSAGVHTVSGQTVTMPQATPAPQMATFASPQPPTIAPKVSGIGQPTAGASQTFLVPVAGASANGTMTLIGPPGGTNLASSQYRFTTVQASPKPTGVTVREMLDNKQTGGVLPVTQVNITSNPNQSESGVQEKVIDLTEDEENSSAKSTLTPITLAPGQVIVQGPMTSKSNGNIPTGTYLVPVTSGQPIILQSVVQQQLQQPLLLSSTRPGVSQQQIAPATGQQLVNLVPAQAGVRPLLIQTPAATQPVSTTTQVVSKSVPAAHTTTAKPITSKQLKHPAPLPPQPTTSKIGAEFKSPPPKPKLTISRVPQGIVLSWNLSLTDSHAAVANYQLYAYQEGTSPPVSSLWKRVGDVKALPLPMACTLTQFHEGNKYYFAVRGVDEHGRVGPFSDPNSIHLDPASTS